jgi:uncharacterized DUF497 family protein
MAFDWNPEKSRENLRNHKVSFELATEVFGDPNALSVPDEYEFEERWKTMGLVKGVVVLVVIHTYRGDENEEINRIISARKATRHEAEEYERASGNGK